MQQHELFTTRLQALRQELTRAQGAVEDIYPRLGKRIQSGFSGRFQDLQERLRMLEQGILEADGYALNLRWGCLQRIREEVEPLFRESLALVQGSLVRSSGLDGGLCRIADALLLDLSQRTFIPWGRFTILDLGESFGPLAQVIRIRFPEASVWSLPVAAHEFGHFVAPRLEAVNHAGKTHHPVKEFLEREGKEKRQRYHLEELFADLLATYVLGPAYACACILLRWDPWTAYVDDWEEHPSDATRVYWILKVLDVMNENTAGGEPTYWRVAKDLRDGWRQSLRLVGQPESLEEALEAQGSGGGEKALQQLDRWFRELWQAVGENSKLVDARYTGQDWLRAQVMLEQLRPKTSLVVGDVERVADVLNAAWWCRVRYAAGDAELLHRIGERAVTWCQEIAERELS